MRAIRAGAIAAVACCWALPAVAQPEPSIKVGCAALRAALAALPPAGDEIVTIQVEGVVTLARTNDAVAIVVVCQAPDPQVACVTYTTEDRQPGDRIVVAGAYTPRGPDRIVLDPCIHFEAGKTP